MFFSEQVGAGWGLSVNTCWHSNRGGRQSAGDVYVYKVRQGSPKSYLFPYVCPPRRRKVV